MVCCHSSSTKEVVHAPEWAEWRLPFTQEGLSASAKGLAGEGTAGAASAPQLSAASLCLNCAESPHPLECNLGNLFTCMPLLPFLCVFLGWLQSQGDDTVGSCAGLGPCWPPGAGLCVAVWGFGLWGAGPFKASFWVWLTFPLL